MQSNAAAGLGHHVDVVIVATKAIPFRAQKHHGGNLVMGIVRMGQRRCTPFREHAYKQSWQRWAVTDPQSFQQASQHVAHGMNAEDNIFEYPIMESVCLETQELYVKCPPMREFAKHGAEWYSAM